MAGAVLPQACGLCGGRADGCGWLWRWPGVWVFGERAEVTHEAAIGSVDKKQVKTLISRGLDGSEAVEVREDGEFMLGFERNPIIRV